MNRIPNHEWGYAIGRAKRITRRFDHLLGNVHFLGGIDPVFAGLHRYDTTNDGRAYGATAHCAYAWHQTRPADQRQTTIVLPTRADLFPSVIVHELGHALHAAIDFDAPNVRPVSEYAKTNSYEAFAEAFTSWLFWNYADEPDDATTHLFASLAE